MNVSKVFAESAENHFIESAENHFIESAKMAKFVHDLDRETFFCDEKQKK